MGLLGKPRDAQVWELIRPAVQKLIKAGIPVGTLVFDPAFAKSIVAEGFSFVACGSDAVILARGADRIANLMQG